MAGPLDVFGSWREALQKWEQETNAALTAASSDEHVSRAMNQSLSLMARMQAAQAEAMETALGRANLPSRADIRHLDARLDSIEAQVVSLTALVRRLAPAETAAASEDPSIPRPARTRKPPSAATAPQGRSAEAEAPGQVRATEAKPAAESTRGPFVGGEA